MKKIILAGGAGLVGQSLLKVLDYRKYQIIVIDKDKALITRLKPIFPHVKFITMDLSNREVLEKFDISCDYIVTMQAQIKGIDYDAFKKNAVICTQNLLRSLKNLKKKPYLIHISSSVINSKADDFYTRSKRDQEKLIQNWTGKKVILRPTLMYGEGDNKHFYVLLNLMRKFHFFPLPGNGIYIRQPLFAMDFAKVIDDCIKNSRGGVFNISGLELISFKDCLIKLKKHYKYFAIFIPIPIVLFRWLLRFAALITKKTPFTEQQLDALIIPETFEMIDWPKTFKTTYTKFEDGIKAFEYKFK